MSSTLQELAEERVAARRAIESLHLTPVLFELGARPHPPRDLYRAYLEQSHVFVGIYWQRYGWVAPGETISGLEDEYMLSGDRPKLIYVKSPAPEREERLASLLDHVRADDRASYKPFSSADELGRLIGDDLALLLTERFELASSRSSTRPEARAASSHSRLPALSTRTVGREREAGEVVDLLLEPSTRFVTLVGPGGVGKTRLAFQAADRAEHHFADGIRYIPLAQVRDPNGVLPAVAETLEIAEVNGRPLAVVLDDALRDQEVLLVFDNFEHLVSGATALGDLLAACAGVRALVTSRVALRLSSEREYIVYPLEVPPPGGRLTAEELAQVESVQLFVDRAQAVKPGFSLDGSNADAVAEICRRLEGIPLSIELAAARVRLLPPQVLVQRLDSRLTLLTGGPRDVPDRQRTLRGAIDWSYQLLAPPEQKLFRRLALFKGGATLEAIESVCGHDEPDLLERIVTLVDGSLLRQGEDEDLEPRFTMLETIREYALERLEEVGETSEAGGRLTSYFVDLAEAAVPGLSTALQVSWLRRLERDADNFRTALTHSLESHDAPAALRACVALRWFWELRGHFREGREWLRQALLLQGASPGIRGAAENAMGVLAWRQGDLEEARGALGRALTVRQEIGDEGAVAGSLLNLGNVALEAGDHAAARQHLSAALEIRRRLGNDLDVAKALVSLGNAAVESGDLKAAQALYEESLAIMLATGGEHGVALVKANLAVIARYSGDLAKARELHQESLTVLRAAGDRVMTANGLEGLGRVAQAEGDLTAARASLEESLEEARSIGYRVGTTIALTDLGFIARLEGNSSRAESALREALVEAERAGYRRGEAGALIGLGFVSLERGDVEDAAATFRRALSAAGSSGDLRAECLAGSGLARAAALSGAGPEAREAALGALELSERLGDAGLGASALLAAACAGAGHPRATEFVRAARAYRQRDGRGLFKGEAMEIDQVASLLGRDKIAADTSGVGDALSVQRALALAREVLSSLGPH